MNDRAPESTMRRIALTSLAGTSIEWYDFFIYGTAAALVFPTAFFPKDMPQQKNYLIKYPKAISMRARYHLIIL